MIDFNAILNERIKYSQPQEDIFSPRTFDDYVGQKESKSLAKIIVQAAKKENRPLPNVMIVGEYGLGKTSLARLILQEFGKPVTIVDGNSVNKDLPTGHIIIDEIHNLKDQTADSLNIVLDRGEAHVIGCTTNPGMLPAAFRSRFRTLFLEPYSIVDLADIIRKAITRKGVKANANIIREIAQRSRFNARQATMFLSLIFDLIVVKGESEIRIKTIRDAFERLGVDEKGYLKRDYLYLSAFPEDGRPVGLQSLSARTGMDEDTIKNEVEPYLLRTGMLDITPRGRKLLKV